MITKNAMQLKAYIKKKAAEKNISAQLVMQNYMLERLLERISLSEYKPNFILKGGFLISAIVGLDTRATMDLDTTIKGYDLTIENLQQIFESICSIKVDDDVTFEIYNVSEIREGDEYPGYRVHLKALYAPLAVPLMKKHRLRTLLHIQMIITMMTMNQIMTINPIPVVVQCIEPQAVKGIILTQIAAVRIVMKQPCRKQKMRA